MKKIKKEQFKIKRKFFLFNTQCPAYGDKCKLKSTNISTKTRKTHKNETMKESYMDKVIKGLGIGNVKISKLTKEEMALFNLASKLDANPGTKEWIIKVK